MVLSSSAVSASVSVDDIRRERVALLEVAESKESEGAKAHAAPTAVERMASFIFLIKIWWCAVNRRQLQKVNLFEGDNENTRSAYHLTILSEFYDYSCKSLSVLTKLS